jgi:hypothetical protein
MSLKGRITNIHEILPDEGVSYGHSFVAKQKTKVATVPIGYADGLSRLLSNKIYGKLNDKKIKQIGNVISDSTFKYMVVGFTDSIGSVEYNEKLAEKRAKSVYNKLVDLGVKPEQIEIKYVGKNSSFGDSGSYINRRVSVYRIIK